jgi:predicted nucleic acid-binding protein
VAVKWVMKGESHRAQARRFLEDSLSDGIRLISPPLFENETESVIQEQVYLKRVSLGDADRALKALDLIGVEIIYDPLLKEHARQIARKCNQSRVYDSTYAALAEIRGCEFWTADKHFCDAAKKVLHFVRFLHDYK